MEMREMEATGEDTRSIQDSTLAAGTEVKAENASDVAETSEADAATPSPEATQTAPEPEAEAEVESIWISVFYRRTSRLRAVRARCAP